jgi:hypothetical protein
MAKNAEMTQEEKERYKTRLLNRIQFSEEQRQKYFQREKEHQSEFEFRNALIMGLVLGIVGNLFVQYLYATIESFIGIGVSSLTVNVTLLLVSIGILTAVFYQFNKRRKWLKEGVKIQQECQSLMRIDIGQTQCEIEDLEKKKN